MPWHNNAALYIIKVYDPLPARRVPVACPGDVSRGDAVFARRLPLRMRSAPWGGGGKAAAGWKKLGKAYGRRVKIEKNRKKSKKSP
ncbi:hypothetical protein B5F83_10480 [Muribaculum sp. An289]|nr:hypothetical protein B5F83_10480 [Muribaculum sp. An289]OUO38884.1 hypothetical protein B5F81_10570 [Muribaculum sp. An287]